MKTTGIAGVAVLTAAAGTVAFGAAPANAALATSGGEIGIVDTAPATPGTQGATLVQPGKNGQSLADIQLLVPNSFANQDTIVVKLYDRTAQGTNGGSANSDAAHALTFSAKPTVSVDATPYVAGTHIGSALHQTQNSPVPDTSGTKPTTPPAFTATVVGANQVPGCAAGECVALSNSATNNGTASDVWVVTLKGVKVDVGAALAPGEIRAVPYGYDGIPGSSSGGILGIGSKAVDNTTFGGNTFGHAGGLLGGAEPAALNTYTVPAYVSPVAFDVAAPSTIKADGTAQAVGNISIDEANNIGLQNGTYQVKVTGADIANTVADPVTVTVSNPGAGASASSKATISGNAVSFTLNQDEASANTSKVQIAISGLKLSSTKQQDITYTLSGGSIDQGNNAFLVEAGAGAEVPAGYAGNGDNKGVPADSAFGPNAQVNQSDIAAPAVTFGSTASAVGSRIGGNDRYATAAQIAVANGPDPDVVIASGEAFPDALSSAYLAQRLGGANVLLVKRDDMPFVTLAALRVLGAKNVYVIGGPSAVSDNMVDMLRRQPVWNAGGQTKGTGNLTVQRLSGEDRYATNQAVNSYAVLHGTGGAGTTEISATDGPLATALLATGADFADALAAGPATAGGEGGALPLILTKGTSLSSEAQAQLTAMGIKQVVIVGGTSAVWSSVETQLTSMGIKVLRISGADRYGTAAALADFETRAYKPTATTEGGLGFDTAGSGDEVAYLATGLQYADALAAGPLAGNSKSPVLLTRTASLSPATGDWLTAHKADYAKVTALGLTSAVSDAALAAANADIS